MLRPVCASLSAVYVLALSALSGCSATGGADGSTDPASDARPSRILPWSGMLGLNLDPRFGRPCEAGHASIDQLRYLGVDRVRVHPTVLPGEGFDDMVAAYRAIVDRYRSAGIHVLAVVNEETVPGAPGGVRIGDWARSNPQEWQTYVETFAASIGDLSAALGEGVTYEAWNEPDDNWHDDGGAGYFTGEIRGKHLYPDQFAKIVTRTTQVVHDRSGSPVISGGVSSGDPRYLDRMGDFEADGVGIHFYNIWAGDDLGSAPAGPWFNVVSYKIGEYRGSAGGRGLYLTEWGTQQIGEDGTAELISTFFGNGSGAGLEEAYYFAWCDCQDGVAQSLTTDGREAHLSLWEAWRGSGGVSYGVSLGSRCLPDPSQSCDDDGDPGCFIAQNLTCEGGGNGACGGVGPATSDCDHCCVVPSSAPPPSCYCEGYDQNGDFVSTDVCGATTCSTDWQQWICEPGSVDYQPNGNYDLCSF